METSTANHRPKPMSFEKKETSINDNIFKSLITNAAKNLELFCLTLSNAKEKFKTEADSFMQHLRKSEENINKLIEDKTKYYDSIREKVKEVFERRGDENLEELDLNEDKQIKEIVYECNDFGNFFKYFKTIDEEIKSLEALKENKSLREYVENTKSFLQQAGLEDLVKSKGLYIEGSDNNAENLSFANAPTEAVLLEKVKNGTGNKPKNGASALAPCESSSMSSEPEKFVNKYLKTDTPSSDKFLGKKRLHSSGGEVESTNTNNHDEVDLLKDSEENSANEDQKKSESEKAKTTNATGNSNNTSKESNTSAKKSNRYAMKREIVALGLTTKASTVQPKKRNTAANTNSNSGSNSNKSQAASGAAAKVQNTEKNQTQDLGNLNSSNSVDSDTIDLVSSSNANLNSNNLNTNANRTRNTSTSNANPNGNPNNGKSKAKVGKSSTAAEKASSSETALASKNDQSFAKQTNANSETANPEKLKMIHDNPVVKSQKYIENSTELYRNIDTLISLIKRDKHNYLDYILKNFEECLFKQRIFYCEFDMLNKNRKCTSDLLAKDSIFENSENYEYVKLTIVRKGKQNINNLLKSMENFFKQYIKRKDIDGSAVIKGSLNCSFDKLQKYFTMQMRSFEYCEAIQLEVYLFKWDLFYDFDEKEDKTNVDGNLIMQYKNFANMLRETRILEKKRSLMIKLNETEGAN